MTEQRPGALTDLLVLDLADEKGMYAGKLLADMGARVILVEPPGGHMARHMGPFRDDRPDPNASLSFWYHATNKESVTLDIADPAGARLLRDLAGRADIVLESFQPGYLDSLGIGYDALSEINPRLIMASITGFGQTGPYRDYRTSDLVAMAMGGPMASCGYDDVPGAHPIRCDGWPGYATGCHYAVMGTLAALYYRDVTGHGQWVDASIHEALSCTTEAAMPHWFYAQSTPIRQTGRHHALQPTPSTQFETADGKLINVFGVPPQTLPRWDALVAWMDEHGMAGELKDESYRQLIREGQRRGPHVERIFQHLRGFIASLPADEVYHRAQGMRIPWAVIRSPEENLDDAHFREDRGFFVEVEHPEAGGAFLYPGAPYVFSGTPWAVRRRAPLLGEDNERVYGSDLGLEAGELAALKRGGVI